MRILLNIRGVLSIGRHSQILKTNPRCYWTVTSTDRIAGANVFTAVSTQSTFPNLKIFQISQRYLHGTHSNASLVKDVSNEKDPAGVSIYSGKSTARIVRVKLFSFFTSFVGIYAQPVLWTKSQEIGSAGLGIFICSIAGIFTFVTPVLLHFIMKKYVVDIRYNKETDEYTAVTISFFLFKNKTKFKIDDIHVPEVETMFTSLKVGPKQIPLFVDSASFTDTHHYARFMGYDKPLKFDFPDEIEPSKVNETINQLSNIESKQTKTDDKQQMKL